MSWGRQSEWSREGNGVGQGEEWMKKRKEKQPKNGKRERGEWGRGGGGEVTVALMSPPGDAILHVEMAPIMPSSREFLWKEDGTFHVSKVWRGGGGGVGYGCDPSDYGLNRGHQSCIQPYNSRPVIPSCLS